MDKLKIERGRRETERRKGHGRLYLHRYSSQVNGILFRTRIVATEDMSVCLRKREKVRGGWERRYVSISFLRSKVQLASFPGHTSSQVQ